MSELAVIAREKVELMRTQSGQLVFHRYTQLGGIRFVLEMVGDRDFVRIDLDEFTRAFHGRATKESRKKAKAQMRRLLSLLIDDGWRVAPDYDERHQLSGIIYMLTPPEHDDQGMVETIRDRIGIAKRQRDLKEHRLRQLLSNWHDILENDSEDEDNDDDEP